MGDINNNPEVCSFTCPTCYKIIEGADVFERHHKQCFQCEKCQFFFTWPGHRIGCLGPRNDKRACDVCRKMVVDLRRHKERTHGMKFIRGRAVSGPVSVGSRRKRNQKAPQTVDPAQPKGITDQEAQQGETTTQQVYNVAGTNSGQPEGTKV